MRRIARILVVAAELGALGALVWKVRTRGSIALAGEESGQMAPELTGGSAWLGVEQPIRMADLRGQVVVLDFWTYG
ncbi:MAG: hypothetical protein ACYCWW_08130 [Deltaproteobacteria bacterium]